MESAAVSTSASTLYVHPKVVQTLRDEQLRVPRDVFEAGARLGCEEPSMEQLGLPPPSYTVDPRTGEPVEPPSRREGLPRVERITLPEPERPYMMDPEKEPGYSIAAFTPLWREVATNVNVELYTAINGFRALIAKHNKNEGAAPTHVALNQGKLHIPWGTPTNAFLGGLALALQSHRKCWFTEIKTPWFRFFVDLDFVQPEKLRGRQIECAVHVAMGSVRKFFRGKHQDDRQFYAIVCSTGYKPVFASKADEKVWHAGVAAQAQLDQLAAGGASGAAYADLRRQLQVAVDAQPTPTGWKTGVHIIWVNLYVDNERALVIRETLIADLAAAFGVRVESMNDWSDVVDASVYLGSGLRMILNRKSEVCPQCKRTRKVCAPATCDQCAASGGRGTVVTTMGAGAGASGKASSGGRAGAEAREEDAVHATCGNVLHWRPVKKADEDAGVMWVKCPTCDGNGQVDTGRPYAPMFVVDGTGFRRAELEEVYRKDWERLIRDTTIRWRGVPVDRASAAGRARAGPGATHVYEEPPGQGFTIYKGAPLPCTLKILRYNADGEPELYMEGDAYALTHPPSKRKKAGSGGGGAPEQQGGAGAGAGAGGKEGKEPTGMNVVLARGDPLTQRMQDFIRGNAGTLYRELRVVRVATNAKRTCYFANVHGPNCNYCHNIGREHTSNRIYFMFTKDGMVQRCHDRADVATAEMKHGPCRTYRSALVALPTDLKVALFPACADKHDQTTASALGGVGAGIDEDGGLAGRQQEDDDHLLADDLTKMAYNPLRDPKILSLFHMGDRLCTELYNVPWSTTVVVQDRKRVARVRADEADWMHRTAASKSRHPFALVAADFGSLGRDAATTLQARGFAPAPVPAPAAVAPASGAGGGLTSSLSDALTGGYDDTASAPANVTDDPPRPTVPLQRLRARLDRQLQLIVDVATSMSSTDLHAALDAGNFQSLALSVLPSESRGGGSGSGGSGGGSSGSGGPRVPRHLESIVRVACDGAAAAGSSGPLASVCWQEACEKCTTEEDKAYVRAAWDRWESARLDMPQDAEYARREALGASGSGGRGVGGGVGGGAGAGASAGAGSSGSGAARFGEKRPRLDAWPAPPPVAIRNGTVAKKVGRLKWVAT